jgi:hypothetical protein
MDLSRRLPGGTMQRRKQLNQDSSCPDKDARLFNASATKAELTIMLPLRRRVESAADKLAFTFVCVYYRWQMQS